LQHELDATAFAHDLEGPEDAFEGRNGRFKEVVVVFVFTIPDR
jgi:hypothetical protein